MIFEPKGLLKQNPQSLQQLADALLVLKIMVDSA